MITIYHNPRCSKSRDTLKLLQDNKQQVVIKEYLKSPPTSKELQQLLKMLDLHPRDILRKQEALYKEKYHDQENTDQQWIKIMAANPILIERPIVIKDGQAVIGRPPSNVLSLF